MSRVVSGVNVLVGLVALIGAAAWGLFELKQYYDQRLADIDSRLASVEAVSPDADGSAVLRRISTLEQQLNQLNEDVARHQADFNRLDSSASGLGGQLAERVNLLERQLANLSGRDESADEQALQAIERRLDDLEARLSSLGAVTQAGARALNAVGGGPALVDTDFRADVRGLDFRLLRCHQHSVPVCRFTIENTTRSDVEVTIATDNDQRETHGYNQNSVLVPSSYSVLGTSEGRDYSRFTVPSGLRMQGEIRFSQVPEGTEYFQILRVYFYDPGREWVEFRNVPVE